MHASEGALFPRRRTSWPKIRLVRAAVSLAVIHLVALCALAGLCRTQQADAATTSSTSGYWMLGANGKVFPFGSATWYGDISPFIKPGYYATHLEPTPDGHGYWIVDMTGHVCGFGDAWEGPGYGGWCFRGTPPTLESGEIVVSLSATTDGQGFWLFSSLGRVFPYGDAPFYGDLSGKKLNGPVLDSIRTASGKGYYMVASDGGIFTFGDATFYGSMGSYKLNAPVRGLAPTPSGAGYWLVASDGGIFSFGDAVFKGSMGSYKLNKPVIGMVAYGNGYLMVATDGGIFDFSDQPFQGSLGGNPPPYPIDGVAPTP